ncbi:NADP-dependent oxidoreductase [Gryllotalpicola sp.]|uniref:NADP-dependent oxidoreductase n=1 Tax=Gryllotalpicola sp. TaxID=1932787 RepID=UPI0026341D5E|nr:NADP-dependent oxidoreductase [Gryllotalpicola sp.]
MARFARYDRFGGPDVIEVVDLPEPHPGPGQMRVRVRFAGLNPIDYKIFGGLGDYGVVLPSGVGQDFSGDVDEVGEGATGFAVGDAVLGAIRHQGAGDFVIADPGSVVVRKPEGLAYELAGALGVAGRTAWASVAAIDPQPGETVFVSAAAGGVGILAAQLVLRAGASVVGTAGEANHSFLEALGVTPVVYGDGLVERLREAAPGGYQAALDNHGPESIDAALELGIPLSRINTIAARGYRDAVGAGAQQASPDDFARLADLVASGELKLPIDSQYPLERIREAYAHLMGRHVRGKVLLDLGA